MRDQQNLSLIAECSSTANERGVGRIEENNVNINFDVPKAFSFTSTLSHPQFLLLNTQIFNNPNFSMEKRRQLIRKLATSDTDYDDELL
ncbi:hypothetical protein PRIPAC_74559 [Pristionchus pacificus]|uniref:Uncharacterized protein n=1 Tax=Pristionchus pacificus TaxID=54126 RepID=A0A2A6C0E6_PRIPA|nr:hypothetical protein PRIPAC_74559 [Pristionchus pacificus]|eukprot:PDM71589.1 hypothetical protein PRIPAC_37996 [Pristionchus pacificus]